MMARFICSRHRLAIIVLLLGLSAALPVPAETTATQPASAVPPETPAPATDRAARSSDDMMSGHGGRLVDGATALTDALKPILESVPRLPTELQQLTQRVADSAGGSLLGFLAKLGAAFIAAFAVLEVMRRMLAGVRRRRLATAGAGLRLGALATSLAADVAAVLALLVVTYGAHVLWFADDGIASQVAVSLLGALVYWRLMLVPVDLVLRHREAGTRLVDMNDMTAQHLRVGASTVIACQVFSTGLLAGLFHAGVEIAGVRFLALCLGILNAAVALYYIRRVRLAATAGTGDGEIAAEGASSSGSSALFQRFWYPAALGFVGIALSAWFLGVVFKNLKPFWALIDTAGILVGIWVLDVIVGDWLARYSSKLGDDAAGDARRRWQRVVRQCFDVALWLGAAGFLIELWIVRLSGILPSEDWVSMRGSIGSAIATIYVAYVLWQVVFAHTERHIRAPIQANADAASLPIASRLQTVLPILRVFMLVAIAVLAGLIALSNLGVNTTSLIAGASIFGLAISFGSQALVRDIVSGIFFMADDAFRIGEYIDTGKLKGTVEGMSIRSLRLRHQNGQIHVIPFGTIQHVTNFSRDWTTVKFNLQLAHDTDIEQVRKAVKQIGVEMMSDPELGPEMIAPLKMQGVNEIGPTAVVVRFKFTVRPVQPTFVYRTALRRMYNVFREKGIEFANPTVYVQSRGGAVTAEPAAQLEAMGAAANATTPHAAN